MTNKLSRSLKKIIDITSSILLLILLSPLLAIITLLLLLVEGRPIFYISERYISSVKSVRIFKFRTMKKDALDPKYALEERYMRDGYLDIPLSCEVYTPLGRLLERSQIVEALQLFNVIFNGMSLIGNRPLPKRNVEMLKKFSGWEGRFNSPAGLTGIAQVVGKLNIQPQERIELEDLYSKAYLNGNVLRLDSVILFCTFKFILFSKPLRIDDARRLLKKWAKK